MTGFTPTFAIPYPTTRGTVIRASDAQLTAGGIDNALSTVDSVRAYDLSQATACVGIFGANTIPAGVSTILTFDTERWDTAGLVNLTLANNYITLPDGRWDIQGEFAFTGGFIPTSVRVSLKPSTAAGATYARKTITTNGDAVIPITIGTVVATSGGTGRVYASLLANGTGSGFGTGFMSATRLGNTH